MKQSVTVFIVAVLAAFALPRAARAQSVGSISGTLRDSSGAVIAGATVTATNQGTNQARTVNSDASGHYVIPQLPIGVYTLAASAPGFGAGKIENATLEVNQSLVLDFILRPATVATQVSVSGQAPEVATQTADATIGQVIHSNQIAQLPLNGRDFVQLALLSGGTVRPQNPGNFLNQGGSSEVSFRGSVGLSAQGMRENANDWLYDGIDDNELTAGGVGFLPSIDAIQEFKVLLYNYSAQYGSRGGTTVLISSKAGTNNFHGTLFEFLRNDHLDARNYFDPAIKHKYIQNEFGASLGGPIVKDKTFFFTDFQVNLIRQGLTVLATVPTMLMRQGIFTESFPGAPAPVIYDPNTTLFNSSGQPIGRTTFMQETGSNAIPLGRIDPIGQAIVNMYPKPTFSDRLSGNYLATPVKTLDDAQWDFRLDHSFSNEDHFFGRFSWDNANQYLPTGLPGFGMQSNFYSNTTYYTHARNVVASETHVFSPNTLNVFTAGYNRDFNYIFSYGYGMNEAQKLGIPGANLGTPETSEMTQIGTAGFNPIGDRQYSPYQGGTNVYEYEDTVNMVRGQHSIDFGFMSRFMQENTLGNNCYAGCFSFNSFFTAGINPNGTFMSGTGSTIASLLLGLPSSGSRNNELGGFKRGRRWKEYRGFVNDTWQARHSLTLNLGFAYHVTTPVSEAHNRFSNIDFYTGQIYVAGQNAGPNIGVKTDWGDVEPRFGLAWSPFGNNKTVFRGGYGIYHDVGAEGGTQGPYQNPPYSNAYQFVSDNVTPIRTLGTGFPDNSQPTNPAVYTGVWHAWGIDYKQGLVQQWNFDIERELPWSSLLTVAYLGTHGTRLMDKNFDLNSATPGSGFDPASRRPYPQYQNIYDQLSRGWIVYNAMQAKLERRAAKGLYLIGSYTYSKAMTNGLQQEITHDPGADYYPFVPFPNADKGLAGNDLRQNFTLSFLYALPFGSGATYLSSVHGVPEAILGGWQLSGIVIAHSGFPLGFSTLNNQSGTSLTNRPNLACNPFQSMTNQSISAWFNKSCFVAPTTGALGDMGRTFGYGPGQTNLDFAVHKNFTVTETSALNFRAEFFNILNHSQFAIPNTAFGNPSFGQIQSTVNTNRQIQFALKYVF